MRHWERLMVAVTAVIAMAVSTAFGLTLWRVWRHPLRLELEYTSSGVKWQGERLAAELELRDGAFEQLVVWRRTPGFEQAAP